MNLSEISDLLAWGAATAYTVAMIAFAMDLSKMSEEIGQRKAERRADRKSVV